MLYHSITIGEQEYKCALNMKALVEIEKRLGENPMNVLMEMGENKLPSFEKIMVIFHQSLLKYQHGISIDESYDLYDKYCEDDKTFADFINELIGIFKTSGLIPDEKKAKKTRANSGKN